MWVTVASNLVETFTIYQDNEKQKSQLTSDGEVVGLEVGKAVVGFDDGDIDGLLVGVSVL